MLSTFFFLTSSRQLRRLISLASIFSLKAPRPSHTPRRGRLRAGQRGGIGCGGRAEPGGPHPRPRPRAQPPAPAMAEVRPMSPPQKTFCVARFPKVKKTDRSTCEVDRATKSLFASSTNRLSVSWTVPSTTHARIVYPGAASLCSTLEFHSVVGVPSSGRDDPVGGTMN